MRLAALCRLGKLEALRRPAELYDARGGTIRSTEHWQTGDRSDARHPPGLIIMETAHSFERKLAEAWPPAGWNDVIVLAAVSGGADSVALVRALQSLAGEPARLVAGHFNHALRGEQSEADQAFVEDLCQRLGVRCLVGRSPCPLPNGQAAASSESTLRAERYAFLQQTAEQVGARCIATAHTRDDQAETVLHHVLRGTGLAGLAGIRRRRSLSEAVTLVRPMLTVRRGDVLEYLSALGQPFRQDATNAERRYTRNRLRHDLLPQLERDYGPGVADALVRLAAVAGEAQAVIDEAAGELLERAPRARQVGFDTGRARLPDAGRPPASPGARAVRRPVAAPELAAGATWATASGTKWPSWPWRTALES